MCSLLSSHAGPGLLRAVPHPHPSSRPSCLRTHSRPGQSGPDRPYQPPLPVTASASALAQKYSEIHTTVACPTCAFLDTHLDILCKTGTRYPGAPMLPPPCLPSHHQWSRLFPDLATAIPSGLLSSCSLTTTLPMAHPPQSSPDSHIPLHQTPAIARHGPPITLTSRAAQLEKSDGSITYLSSLTTGLKQAKICKN